MFQSATLKLTAGYLAIIMAISFIFSGVVYHIGTRELERGLHHQTERIYNDFPVFNNNSFVQPRQDLQAGAHRLLGQLILFNLLVLAGAGLASYYLARRTLEPIEEAHARQLRFTADVSHELRTPLTALKMEAEVALMDAAASKPALRKTLQSTIEEADKLNSLINNLLRLSQLEDGEVRTNFTKLALNKVVEDATAKTAMSSNLKHITIASDIKHASLNGDYDSLVQLLTILLDNAIKYSPEHSTVHLTSNQSGDTVSLQVRDEGIGIEPSALDHVFDRFYRADTSRQKTTTEGYGLGLSIAKMIADIHGGSLTLSSRVGHGTTATINLPSNPKSSQKQ